MLGPSITAKVGNVTLWARKLPSASDSCEQGSAVSLWRPALTAAGQGRRWGTVQSAGPTGGISAALCSSPCKSQQDTRLNLSLRLCPYSVWHSHSRSVPLSQKTSVSSVSFWNPLSGRQCSRAPYGQEASIYCITAPVWRIFQLPFR